MAYGLTIPAPEGPVNPAELPVADAVLEAGLIEHIDPAKYNDVYRTLVPRHPNLQEEIHYRLSQRSGHAQASVMVVAR